MINTAAAIVMSTASINCHMLRLLYVAYSIISDHITLDDNYHLLLLCKAKRYNIKWKIMNF